MSPAKAIMAGVIAGALAAAGADVAGRDRNNTVLAGQVSVIDGDTLELHGQRIRLLGIDAPESSQPCRNAGGRTWRCGAEAANRLSDFIASRPVTCRVKNTDRYGRSVAVCTVAGQDIGRWAVTNGWALAYRRYSKDYIGAEEQARISRRGIHAGQFMPPWDYRVSKRNHKTGMGGDAVPL